MKTKISIAVIFTALVLCAITPAAAQEKPYKIGLGLRTGWYGNYGLDGKFFINDQSAIEVIATTRGYNLGSYYSYRYSEIMALYQKQKKLTDDVEGLNWYAGGGASVGFFSDEIAANTFSIAAVAGVEYTFPKLPITVSIDWMPRFFLSSNVYWSGFSANSGGLRVAYTIK